MVGEAGAVGGRGGSFAAREEVEERRGKAEPARSGSGQRGSHGIARVNSRVPIKYARVEEPARSVWALLPFLLPFGELRPFVGPTGAARSA